MFLHIFFLRNQMDQFDAVDWINQHLTSLRHLEAVKSTVRTEIAASTSSLHAAVIAHCENQPKGLEHVQSIRKDIRGLFSEVSDLRSKSQTVEGNVNSLIGDIRHYDTAKNNLAATIDVVERVRAVELKMPEMSVALSERNYSEVGRCLAELCGWLSALPPGSRAPTRVQQLRQDVGDFRRRCEGELEKIMAVVVTDDVETDISPEACALVDQLDVRQRLLRRFVLTQGGAYADAFPRGKEDTAIARTERRFAWFRRWLRSYAVSGLVESFPATWYVPQEVRRTWQTPWPSPFDRLGTEIHFFFVVGY